VLGHFDLEEAEDELGVLLLLSSQELSQALPAGLKSGVGFERFRDFGISGFGV